MTHTRVLFALLQSPNNHDRYTLEEQPSLVYRVRLSIGRTCAFYRIDLVLIALSSACMAAPMSRLLADH